MKKRRMNSLGAKLTLMVAFPLIVVMAVSFLLIILNVRSSYEDTVVRGLTNLVESQAEKVQDELDLSVLPVAKLAAAFQKKDDVNYEVRRASFLATMTGVLKANANVVDVWACFEPKVFDTQDVYNKNAQGSDETGRFVPLITRSGNEFVIGALSGFDDPEAGSYYQIPKTTGKETLFDPALVETEGTAQLVVKYAIPIKDENDAVIGVVGADISLDFLKEIPMNLGGYENAQYSILSSGGIFVTQGDAAAIGSFFGDWEDVDTARVLSAIAQGAVFSYESATLQTGEAMQCLLAPLTVGETGTPWALTFAVPQSEVYASVTQITYLLFIALAASLIVCISVTAVLVTRSVSRPIKLAAAKGMEFAAEDFSTPVPDAFVRRNDEIGHLAQAFDALFKNTNALMADILAVSQEVSSGAKLIASSSEELAQGATEQASAIEELSASIEEIASQTRENAKNAGQASQLAEHTYAGAESGNRQMAQMLTAMEQINESSDSISRIIKVIDDIAFQTNILALNAAVEAARAGEQGKGFSVVAQEVRDLAGRSASAAKETTSLIETSIKKVEDGRRIAEETAQAMASIMEEIGRMAQLIGQINIASGEQSTGIAQVNQGILQVSQVVQVNSDSSQQNASTSEQLNRQAEMLEQHISRFKLQKD
jgi:methyl-accepting chemotaxis protein